MRLAARSTRHKHVRSNFISTLKEDEVIQAALGSTEQVYRAHLSAEVERLAGVDIFGQYTPDAMDKTLEDDALAEKIEEYAPSLFVYMQFDVADSIARVKSRRFALVVMFIYIVVFALTRVLRNLESGD
jgi:hypothetical protein